MDKQTFEKEIFNQVEHNYIGTLFNQIAQDRQNMITTFQTTPRVLQTKVDFLYLYTFASMIRAGGVTNPTIDELNKLSPDLVRVTTNWFDRTAILTTQLQSARNTAGQLGVLKDSLIYLPRR